ncbi:hypothetical protein CPB86DRAFT_816059 [Serendipita vermifera]|nr:hypothetical protein CPB86DRAFT_816059 [Serendipita vermifera]
MEDLSPPWDDLPPEYTLRASDALGEFSLDSGPRLRRVQGSPSRNALSSREQLDDGKPTADPTPGHPLLKDGKVLVYPKGFECRKCLNKGFKPHLVFGLSFMASAFAPGDPQSPCKGCWEKYARPYTRLLEEMDWENRPTDANYQRPISRAGNHVNLNVGANFRPKYYENSTPVFNSRVEFETPNDGKPTVSPCPGHPLLMSGHVLIYPIGFKCDKCFNRGFKPSGELFNFQSNTYSFGPADPYNPCKSCWRSFGRHYTEELQQKDWLDPRNTTYQRPIRPSRSEGPSGSQPEASGHRLEDPSTDDGKPTSRPLPGHPLLRDAGTAASNVITKDTRPGKPGSARL